MSEIENTQAEGRKGDGQLILVQENDQRQLLIHEINEAAAEQLGYAVDELKGRKLEVILGKATAETIEDDLEYTDDAPDLGEVLARHRQLRLRLKSGEEISIPMTLSRIVASDRNPRFQLILPNERDSRARDHLRAFLKTSLDGHTQLDEATGLPNRATAEAYLRLLSHYANESGTQAGFAVLRLDRYKKSAARYGEGAVPQLLQHVAGCCRVTFRGDDVVCALGGPYLALFLVDISRESTRVVLNRMRWNIRAHTLHFGGKEDFATTVSTAFTMLTPDNSEAILDKCERSLHELDSDVRNSLIEQDA
jgi:diguanylate cyclase (GGDEF)-like protein